MRPLKLIYFFVKDPWWKQHVHDASLLDMVSEAIMTR